MFGKRLLLIVLTAGLSAPAATISFTFNGEVNSSTVDRSLDSGATWTNTMSVGQMKVTVASTSGFASPVPTVFWTFCVEPQQSVSSGTSYTYTIDPLQDAPTNVSGGMGAVKADLLRELYGRYYPVFQNGTLSVTTAGALQVATWEIVRETSGTYNVLTGTTRFRNPSSSAVLTTANTMLASLNGTGPLLSQMYSIRGTTNQDLAFHSEVTVPEPSTAASLILAAGFGICRRRRGRLSALLTNRCQSRLAP